MAVHRLPPWRLRGRDELQQVLEPCATFGALPFWQGCDAAKSEAAFSHVFALPCMRGVPDEQKLFAAVKRWAMESFDMPTMLIPLKLGEAHEFSAAECRRVLAASFVGNVVDTMSDAKRNYGGLNGGLNFSKLVRECALDAESICAHKLAALLLYFAAGLVLEGTADDERRVRFERIACPPLADFEAMLAAEEAAGTRREWSDVVSLHDGGMEAVADATAFVNFANAEFGYGCFIPSCTQEEILQMACPEFNVGMLLLGRMGEDEVVNVRGCRRFSTYSGYQHTYNCTGSLVAEAASPVVLHDVLTLDACTTQHFCRDRQLRDLRKAFASFAALGPRSDGGPAVVSTGRWGCGIFGGLPAHKFAQQAVAARLAGVQLRFSTFGTPDGCDVVLGALQASGASVPRTFEALLRCADRRAFEESFVPMLTSIAAEGNEAASAHERVCAMV